MPGSPAFVTGAASPTSERYTPEPISVALSALAGLRVPEMVERMPEGMVCEERGTLLEDAVG